MTWQELELAVSRLGRQMRAFGVHREVRFCYVEAQLWPGGERLLATTGSAVDGVDMANQRPQDFDWVFLQRREGE